jgi:hypothetical protein
MIKITVLYDDPAAFERLAGRAAKTAQSSR